MPENNVSKRGLWLRIIALVVMGANLLYFVLPFPPAILRLALILICLFPVFWRIKHLENLEKWMLLFSVINFIYFIIASVARRMPDTFVANNLCAFLPVCLFIFLAKEGAMTQKFTSVLIVVLLLCSIGYYENYQRMRYLYAAMGDVESLTINASTVFLFILPLLFFEKNRILKYAELGICVFFIVSAVKRGNIVAAIIPVLLLLYGEFKSSKRNAFYLLLLLAVVIVGGYFLREYVSSNAYFLKRLDDTLAGNASNRDVIYSRVFNFWSESNPYHFIFGNGYRSTVRVLHTAAHSDWLQILADNGLIGAILYFAIFVALYKVIRRVKKVPNKLAITSAALIWLAKSVYSMAYVENYLFLLMITIGLVVGRKDSYIVQDEPD